MQPDTILFGLFVAVVAVVTMVLYVGSVVWAYNDANARGKPGWLVAILVAFFSWPLGLIIWYLFRPNLPSARRS